ncbi:hypothetical protein VP01_1294g4 [Puccinia sorghi]|uniref:Uncharacterized protein n=1 Tax=Puccinia sorghi TaxID=27349 RepID=A0A0L6VNP5_9BASI|nr:hypothetical protein VP01_1294g4 [Puccinia sorghi]
MEETEQQPQPKEPKRPGSGQPDRVEVLQNYQYSPSEQHTVLPFTTAISSFVCRILVNHYPPNPGLANKLLRYISLLVIRELATLEDLFIKSPIYRLLRFLTPPILPKSSTWPFLLTLVLGGNQLRKLWKHQQQLLINLSLSLGPLINTLRVLTRIQLHHDRIQTPSDGEEESSNHYHELRRWTLYWLVYCSLLNLESLKVWTTNHSHISPVVTRPTIYPSTQKQDNYHGSYPQKAFHLLKNFKTQTSQNLAKLLPNLIRPTSAAPLEISPPRLPIESLDLHTVPAIPGGQMQASLPEYIFGKNRWLYGLLKLGFLRWCGSERNRGCEALWAHVVAPIVHVMGRSSAGNQHNTTARIKVVQVVITSDQDQAAVLDPSSRSPQAPLDHIAIQQAHPLTHPQMSLEGPLAQSPTSWSVRRIQSDPPPARRLSTGPAAHTLADQTHAESRVEDTDLVSTTLPSSFGGPSFKSSPYNPRPHKRSNSSTKTPPALDFKTPDNAWDSLSFVG